MKKSVLLILILIVFGGILFFYNLGGWDLWNPDEPRYAQIAKEMLQGEGWIIPHLNSEVYLDKPPLFFWLMATTAKVIGGMNEFAARFPSALFGLFTLLLLFYLGKRLFNEKVGFLSALILATNIEFLWLAHRANIDATLTFFTTAAITFLYVGFHQQRGRWVLYLLAYLAMALGVLVKLQIGVIVPVLVVGGYFLMQREWRFFKDPSHIPGMSLFVAFIGGWIALAYLSGGQDYLWGLLYQKTAATFFETASHTRPLYYYLVNFPGNFVPWIIFFPSALIYGLSAKGRKKEFIFAFLWFVITFCPSIRQPH
jgi:4-amino-4-deoxy-L-arabinose transferase-like glycosyltransferase